MYNSCGKHLFCNNKCVSHFHFISKLICFQFFLQGGFSQMFGKNKEVIDQARREREAAAQAYIQKIKIMK